MPHSPTRASPTSTVILQRRQCSTPLKPSITLNDLSKCCQVLELLRTYFPHNTQASVILGRAQSRSQEQKNRVHNFKELQTKAKKLRPLQLDHATYIRPVEIRQRELNGRSLFVTKAVKAGDLLLCKKAFSYAHVDEGASSKDKSSSKLTLLMNPETNQSVIGRQADLIKLIVQKLYCNLSLALAFTALYYGTYEAASTLVVDEKPIIDT